MNEESEKMMSEYLQRRVLENKLRLWDTPGFDQFIQDLKKYTGDEIDITGSVKTLKKLYETKLKELDDKDNQFKQIELDL